MVVKTRPHPIRIYSANTSELATGDQLPAGVIAEILPSGQMARLAAEGADAGQVVEVDVPLVPVPASRYGDLEHLPEPAPEPWYAVPRLTTLAAAGREDRLRPQEQVHNAQGTVVGCRAFGTIGPL
ncbi:hypothetical protein [Nonomuraea sp. NPDC049784]|uniref:hypothetical protein n=1 Tax=Nonomuraea sp. NPDC049784 TaxID=3154361 RepID=UPI0034085CE9